MKQRHGDSFLATQRIKREDWLVGIKLLRDTSKNVEAERGDLYQVPRGLRELPYGA